MTFLFEAKDFKILHQREVYSSKRCKLYITTVKHLLFEGGWSQKIQRELIVRNNAVAVLLYDPIEDKVVLIEQFRIGAINDALGPWQWEIIAGIIQNEKNETVVAIEETLEEADYEIKMLIPVYSYLNNPAFSTEKLSLFCGIINIADNSKICGRKDEHENIKVHIIDFDIAYSKVCQGEINNAMTIIALQWLYLNKEKVRVNFRIN